MTVQTPCHSAQIPLSFRAIPPIISSNYPCRFEQFPLSFRAKPPVVPSEARPVIPSEAEESHRPDSSLRSE